MPPAASPEPGLTAAALEPWLAGALGARAARVAALERMSGGAIQENWRLDAELDGEPVALVLRTDAPSALPVSHGRAEEYALLRAARAAGVTVPEPLALCEDGSVTGRPFFVMRRIAGVTDPRTVTRSDTLGGGREALVRRLGAELARIHSITPETAALPFLARPRRSPALDRVEEFRAVLDASARPQPVVEWGARWLERHAPPAPERLVLCHNDFRTGNLMVSDEGVAGVLDWEFAGWGDPHADIGWFCAKCWRFGQTGREAGGIGPRENFYSGYEETAGRPIDREAVPYWEVLAAVRWAVIAVGQGERHLSGQEPSLELALTRHIVPELELDILAATRETAHA